MSILKREKKEKVYDQISFANHKAYNIGDWMVYAGLLTGVAGYIIREWTLKSYHTKDETTKQYITNNFEMVDTAVEKK